MFGKAVKVKLIELNMTQVELSKLLGIKRQYLCRILNGDRSGKKYMDDIIRILGINDIESKETLAECQHAVNSKGSD